MRYYVSERFSWRFDTNSKSVKSSPECEIPRNDVNDRRQFVTKSKKMDCNRRYCTEIDRYIGTSIYTTSREAHGAQEIRV